jgi:hypothetical protein
MVLCAKCEQKERGKTGGYRCIYRDPLELLHKGKAPTNTHAALPRSYSDSSLSPPYRNCETKDGWVIVEIVVMECNSMDTRIEMNVVKQKAK